MATEKEIAKLIITLEGQVKNLKKEFGIADQETNKFAKKQKNTLADLKSNWLLYTAAIAGVAIAIKNLIGPFAQFTHKMLEVRTLLDISNKSFEKLNSTIRDMTRRVPQSATELANALYDIVSAGVEVGKSTKVLELSAKAAVAGVTNTKTAAKTGLAIINAYGKGIGELGNIYDLLFQTIKKGVITFEEIAGSIGQVLPSARAANVGIEDILGSLATMTKGGFDAATAVTAMRAGLVKLAAPTGESADAMKKLGIEWKGWIPTLKQIKDKGLDLKGMREIIPDERSSKAVFALTQNFDTLVETMDEMSRASGSMQTAYNIMKDSPINQTKLLTNAVDDLKISLASAFAPVVLSGIRAITRALQETSLILQGYSSDTIDLMYRVKDVTDATGTFEDKLKALNKIRDETNQKYKEQIQLVKEANEGKKEEFKTTGTLKFLNQQLTIVDDAILELVADYRDGLKTLNKPVDEESLLNTTKLKATAESLKVFNAEVVQALLLLKNTFDDNKITVDEYFDSRKALIEEVYTEESRVLADLLRKTKDVADQEKIRQEIQVLAIQTETELIKLQKEKTETLETYAEKQKEVNDIVAGIEKRVDKRAEDAQEIADLQEKQRKEFEAIKALELQKDDYIKALMKARSLWELELKKLQLEQERRLEEKRFQMLSSSFSNISSAFSQLYEQSGKKLKAFFLISKAAALAEAIVNYNLALLKIDSQLGAYSGFAKVAAAIAMGANIGAIAASTITGFAEGGQVHGQEGRDKIRANLTNREFVQPVPSVDYYGTGIMEAIRRRSIPKSLLTGYTGLTPRMPSGNFQEGGLATGSGVERDMPLLITNIVDPSLIGQYLNTKQGQGMIMNVISDNAYQIKRTLRV